MSGNPNDPRIPPPGAPAGAAAQAAHDRQLDAFFAGDRA